MATPQASHEDGPIVQAHRGFAGIAPENTILAARTAAERFDVDWIEVDVQPTGDGTAVCFHDPALDEAEGSRGITDASGLVRDASDETVLAAEVLDSGETVPTLAALLAALPPDVGVNVELKSPGGPVDDGWLFEGGWLFDDGSPLDDWPFDDASAEQRALWDDFVAGVATVVADEDRPIAFSSFFEGALGAALEHAPDVPRAVIVGGDLEHGMTVAEREDAAAINAPAGRLDATGASFVATAHDAGLAVNAWTITEWSTCRDLAAIGVDGFIADYPFLGATW